MKFKGWVEGVDVGETYEQGVKHQPPFKRAARVFAARYAADRLTVETRPTEPLRVVVEDRHGRRWTLTVEIGWKPAATKAREVEG